MNRLTAIGFALLPSMSTHTEKSTRIAITNPKHAPGGKRSEDALRSFGVWDKIESKQEHGENIAHAAHAGLIALSPAVNPELARNEGYWLVTDKLQESLEKGFILTQRAAGNALCKRFANYMGGAAVRAAMTKHGFAGPGEALSK